MSAMDGVRSVPCNVHRDDQSLVGSGNSFLILLAASWWKSQIPRTCVRKGEGGHASAIFCLSRALQHAEKDMRKCQRHAEPSSFRGSAREWACAALAPTFEEQERHR